MESTLLPPHLVLSTEEAQKKSGLFSSEAVLNILRLIFAAAPQNVSLARKTEQVQGAACLIN
jgi:hypothetical protein